MAASPATELPPGPAKFNSVISNNYLQQVGELVRPDSSAYREYGLRGMKARRFTCRAVRPH